MLEHSCYKKNCNNYYVKPCKTSIPQLYTYNNIIIYNITCRHPAHQHRPSFDVISVYLQQPTGTLVHWNEKDNLIEEDVNVLGADLYAGMQLYPDLQETYKESDYEEAP